MRLRYDVQRNADTNKVQIFIYCIYCAYTLYTVIIYLFSVYYFVSMYCALCIYYCALSIAVEYVCPRNIYYRPARCETQYKASCKRIAACPDMEQGPPGKPYKAPVFDLQCNVSYVASLEPGAPLLLSRKRQGGGQGRSPKSTLAKFFIICSAPLVVR